MTRAGYHGHPIVKPPVWTWEVPLYFFVGGTAGMSAVIALTSLVGDESLGLTRTALWIAFAGALASPILLVLDLSRPLRFLNMLRVLKRRSAMSVGAWTLAAFGGLSFGALFLFESFGLLHRVFELPRELLAALLWCAMAGAAATGALLATYTGVLLGATAIPVWSSHRSLLPLHSGVAGLGSAGVLLELGGHDGPALALVGMAVALVETALFVKLEIGARGARDRALSSGRPALLLRSSGVLLGPLALLMRLVGAWPFAALAFLAGALISRYGWVAAGRASALDPQASLRR